MHFKLYMPTKCWYVHTHCSLSLNRPLDPPRLLETDQDNFHKCHRWKQYNFHTLPAPLSKLKIAIARLLGKAISTNQWYLLQPLSWCSVLQLKKEWTCMLLLGLKMIFESIQSWQSVSESPDSKKNPEVTESESLSDEISPHSLSESPEPHVNVSQEGSVSASFSFTVLVLWIFSKLVWDSAYPFSISCNVPSYSHEVEWSCSLSISCWAKK